ncbi:uncharacterized protein HMPREF1541_09489 [Cyphellophora europaea CBS 101466]|uniref:Altered inheritance of mitochondria protein 11 n=1 Tax=Cyphellophora europaea (strain CBS 101466) TaxID=1220924 RepID=W2SAD4_CYPE1|nr:uncharacterized protein HMPREF1541_09489 [Cyphellophora europaea CBS 101466]ETN45657.1 hypothetical protein HMPREF1541_09489 [Cyphellophora europaea CBS 101466]
MSWFTSLFSAQPSSTSSPSVPEPAHAKRLLEEKAPQTPSPGATRPSQINENSHPPSTLEPQQNPRQNRNAVIFSAGLAFFAFSMLITRRAFVRRRLSANPAFYTNGPAHHEAQAAKVSGPLEAVEALTIATVNVLSVTMMATGGALWYLDINSMQDARTLLRGGLGVDGTGRSEQQAEEEFEEWMASTLARKEAKVEAKGKVMAEVERVRREGR